jgi:hypothetical protein
VLHPCHKLDYFKRAAWPEEWITVAWTIVWDEYELTYKIADREIEVEEIEEVCDTLLFLFHFQCLTITLDT